MSGQRDKESKRSGLSQKQSRNSVEPVRKIDCVVNIQSSGTVFKIRHWDWDWSIQNICSNSFWADGNF